MKISVITLFPEPIRAYMKESMMWKAQKDGLLELELVDLREFGSGPRKTVDDTPYGGGDGMLLKPEPVVAAIEATRSDDSKVVVLTPGGKPFVQSEAERFSSINHLILVAGRYEGFDERIMDYADEQVSIGNYVLTGGELPAMSIIDATVRLIPGVLGGENSAAEESFSDGESIEYPQYTRPPEFRGVRVPDILLTGDHGAIARWRKEQSESKTQQRKKL